MIDIRANQLLNEMRAMALQAQGKPQVPTAEAGNSFSEMLKTSLADANNLMVESSQLQTAFDKGDPNVSLAEVAVASQKAGVAFQAVVQVRNKFIQAYQDVMNMSI